MILNGKGSPNTGCGHHRYSLASFHFKQVNPKYNFFLTFIVRSGQLFWPKWIKAGTENNNNNNTNVTNTVANYIHC